MQPSFSSGFVALDYLKGRSSHYQKFTDQEVGTLIDRNKQGEVASLDYIVRDFFLNETERLVKFILIVNMNSTETREAYLSWSDRLLSEVLKVKERTGASYVLFLLSKRMQDSFKHLIRPRRRKKRDHLRLNHLRSLKIQMIQGRRFFSDSPLKHVKIRRATREDARSISGYIKRVTLTMAIKRVVGEGTLVKEMESLGHGDFSNLALAESHDKKIVGILGVYDPQTHLGASLDLDEVKDSIFFITQSFLKMGSYFKKDLRPVSGNKKPIDFKFFTHIYCNNKDIFYSLIHWWLDESYSTKPVFIYPHYKGEFKTAPSRSLFSSDFPADLYLMQDPDDPPSQLLKPNFFTPHIDIDLPLLF